MGSDEDVHDVPSKLFDPCVRHIWKNEVTFAALLIEEVLRKSSPLKAPLDNTYFLFVFLPHSKKQRCIKLPFNGMYQSPGGWNVVEHPGLGIQYLGKLCSICPPISPSVTATRQESLKAHFWQRDKTGKECSSDNTKKSENIFLCLNPSHRRLKNRELLTVSEKLKLSLPCQELTNSNGETVKVTLRGFSLSLILPSILFSGAEERAHPGIGPGPNWMTENEASETWLGNKARRADGWWETQGPRQVRKKT